jgi:hypothetical protein
MERTHNQSSPNWCEITPAPQLSTGTMVRYQSEEIVNSRFAAGSVAGAP